MKGKMMLLACLLVSACGNGEVENNAAGVASTGQVDGHPDWKMPNSTVYEIVNSPNKKATYGYEFRAKRTKDWESEGWTVWVASTPTPMQRHSLIMPAKPSKAMFELAEKDGLCGI